MECQPTPPLDEMDPQTLGDDSNSDPPSSSSSSSSKSSSTSFANNNTSMTEAEVEAEVDMDIEPTEEEEEQQETMYHAKQYFNSTMGGKDLRVLFAMAVGSNSHELPNLKDPPFCKAKAYHSEVKPDAATLKLEVRRCWNAYIHKGCQPCPSNWKIDKCLEYLMSHPIPTLEKRDLDFITSELDEWKGIQQLINDSHEREEDWIIHHSWSSNIPFLRLYHTLVEDGIHSTFGKAYQAKSCEDSDGRNTSLFQDFYELVTEQFNNSEWIPDSLVLPDLHKDYTRSKPLPLNVAPIMPEQFKKKLNNNRYKMVKIIADWERSGAGAGMVNSTINCEEDQDEDATVPQRETHQYKFLDRVNQKSFLRERPPHILYLWHLCHTYGILTKSDNNYKATVLWMV